MSLPGSQGAASDPEESIQLYSEAMGDHTETNTPPPTAIEILFNEAYSKFLKREEIPDDILTALSTTHITQEHFTKLIAAGEIPSGRFIYLDDHHINFDTRTVHPHGEIICEIASQICLQNRTSKLFRGGTGTGIILI
jgi:hypothetical protein